MREVRRHVVVVVPPLGPGRVGQAIAEPPESAWILHHDRGRRGQHPESAGGLSLHPIVDRLLGRRLEQRPSLGRTAGEHQHRAHGDVRVHQHRVRRAHRPSLLAIVERGFQAAIEHVGGRQPRQQSHTGVDHVRLVVGGRRPEPDKPIGQRGDPVLQAGPEQMPHRHPRGDEAGRRGLVTQVTQHAVCLFVGGRGGRVVIGRGERCRQPAEQQGAVRGGHLDRHRALSPPEQLHRLAMGGHERRLFRPGQSMQVGRSRLRRPLVLVGEVRVRNGRPRPSHRPRPGAARVGEAVPGPDQGVANQRVPEVVGAGDPPRPGRRREVIRSSRRPVSIAGGASPVIATNRSTSNERPTTDAVPASDAGRRRQRRGACQHGVREGVRQLATIRPAEQRLHVQGDAVAARVESSDRDVGGPAPVIAATSDGTSASPSRPNRSSAAWRCVSSRERHRRVGARGEELVGAVGGDDEQGARRTAAGRAARARRA